MSRGLLREAGRARGGNWRGGRGRHRGRGKWTTSTWTTAVRSASWGGARLFHSRREFGTPWPSTEIVVPFARVPRVGLDLARLTREAKVQQTVFELLTQQYEQAKIAEARDSPIVQVLDRAVPAEWKSKPKTTLNTALGGAISAEQACR